MTLIVDFNMMEEDGRVPALLVGSDASSLGAGAKVVATDGEGTECRAIVSEILAGGRYAMLAPIDGTWRTDSTLRPAQDTLVTH